MRPEQWSRIKEVFTAVSSVAPDSRSAILEVMCAGDDALREQIGQMLISHDVAPSFLESRGHLPADGVARDLAGRRLGPYQLLHLIGTGGMGDVYKAHDTRLDRTVAVKVLPAQLATNPTVSARFEKEARAVAALNHPHICTLHDFARHDGIDLLVMEYLEGETLAARLERGPLTLLQAITYAIQIVAALERVHHAGMVHRDIKPSNVMLTRAGAKLMDFGLSKSNPSVLIAGPDHVATAPDLTSAGTILGTMGYMAPECLEGGGADARSDLFAFGAVLYEMLTGVTAFAADHRQALMNAVRGSKALPSPHLPPAIDRIVRICLAEDPDERWQSARDLRRELEWFGDGRSDPGQASVVRSSRRPRMAAAVATAVLAALAAMTYFREPRPMPEMLRTRFDVATPHTGDPISFALSADGRHLAFVAPENGIAKLWVRALDQLDPQPLFGSDGASYPFWSPDAGAIAFFANGQLKRLDLDGAPAHAIADAATARGGTWSRDGTIVFAPTTASPLMRVAATGGVPVAVTRLTNGQRSHRWPRFLPDGRHFLFVSTQGSGANQGVFFGSTDGGEVVHVLNDDSPASYSPPGSMLLARRGALIALPFNPQNGTVRDEPVTVAERIGVDVALSGAALAVSESGVLAFRAALAEPRRLIWADRLGAVRGAVGAADDSAMAAPELSRDGHHIAVFRTVQGNADVWVIDTRTGVPTRLTFSPAADLLPIWHPDGQRLVFTSAVNGQYGLIERRTTGESIDRLLLPRGALKVATDISPDGRFLLYAVQNPQTGVDLWALPLRGDSRPFAVEQTIFDEMAGKFSLHGDWIAYESNRSGGLEVYVRPFPGDGVAQQVSSGGGTQARWGRDGNELFYVATDGRLMAVPIGAGHGRYAVGTPAPLFSTHLVTGANVPPAVGSKPQYDVAPDGRFLLNIPAEGLPAPPITVLTNWQAGTRK